MDILEDIGVSKLSAKVLVKVNYSFKIYVYIILHQHIAEIDNIFSICELCIM